MKKIFLLSIAFIFIFSCKKTNKNDNGELQTKKEANIKVLDENKDFVIFIHPTISYLDSLKKTYTNEDEFFTIADDAHYYVAEAREYISKNNIDTIDLDIDATLKIGKLNIKLSQYKPWSLLLFRKGKIKNIFPVDIQEEFPEFYGINNKIAKETCDVNEVFDLINDLPEVQKQSKFVDSISSGKKRLSFMTDSLEINKQPFYMIKTGFNGEFHWETYTTFYINKNNCK